VITYEYRCTIRHVSEVRWWASCRYRN